VGTVVKSSVDSGRAGEDDDEVNLIMFCLYETQGRFKSCHEFFSFVFSCRGNSKAFTPFASSRI
jgi:hypothetical protein